MTRTTITQKNIRNFVIISHIDHGKSTLADRLLEITGTVETRKMQNQVLDKHPLERERGITIKMSPVRMVHGGYMLNLIDTPGHADFGYEVSRALAAVEGAILLVDATAGVQAQTVSNALQAVDQGLKIIPVVNKIDLPHADVGQATREIQELLGVDEQPLLISAKTGDGVEGLLRVIVERVPPPKHSDSVLRALVFDSTYDAYLGIQAYVRVVDGTLRSGDLVKFIATKTAAEAVALFALTPEPKEIAELSAGTIGLVATGLKEADRVMVGDTIISVKTTHSDPAFVGAAKSGGGSNREPRIPGVKTVEPLPGYRAPQPVVFASFFPEDQDDVESLRLALHRLRLNDAALQITPTSAVGLGRGFRCGCLGLLHLEIIQQRLERDERLSIIVTSPSVVVRVIAHDGTVETVVSPTDIPSVDQLADIEEPWVHAEIVVPNDRIGDVMRLLDKTRGEHGETTTLGRQKSLLRFSMPTAELLRGFYDDVKRITSGFASLSYEEAGFRSSDLVRLDVIVGGEEVQTLSMFVAARDARGEARRLAVLLKEAIPPQMVPVPVQVAVGLRRSSRGWSTGEIIARETKKALRKDVTGYLYGGDVTRKKKLLEKQKKGKKKMKEIGGAVIPPEVYMKILRRSNE